MTWKGGPNYRPPSGIPARGGGARGYVRDTFTPENQPPADHKVEGRVEAAEYREKLRERLQKVLDGYDEALNGENVALKVTVGKQIEERVFGQAKQIVETQADTRTDDEIREAIERRKRELGV